MEQKLFKREWMMKKYEIRCTFDCLVEAEDIDAALSEVSNILLVSKNLSSAVIHCDEHFTAEACEVEECEGDD